MDAAAKASASAALIAVLVISAPFAQQQPPRFRGGVDVVLIDVTVLDKQRQPVRGLTAADFTVLEDGKPQRIVSFDEVAVPDIDGSTVPWMREVAPDVRTNSADERRVVLIVMDDASGTIEWERARRIGNAIVDRLGPGDLASVIYTAAQKRSQEFTADKKLLRASVNQYVDTSMPPQLRRAYSLGTTKRAVEYMIDVPHRRKALIFVGGLGVDVMGGNTIVATLGAPTGDVAGMARDERNLLEEMFERAQRANVTIYPINPAGLTVLTDAGPDLTVETLETMANNTGGFAVVNTNSFADQIGQIFRETGSYYLVGFESAYRDGKFRRINVRVNRPDVFVRTRNGYSAPKPEKDGKDAKKKPSALVKSIAGLLPDPEMPLRVAAAPFALAGKSEAAVAIVLGVREPPPPTDRINEDVSLLATAFDVYGKQKAWRNVSARVALRPAAADARYEVLSRFDLSPGRYMLRLGLRSPRLEKGGSVYHDIEVPNFGKEVISLSGVIIDVTPRLPFAPKDVLDGVVPIVPTTQRDFRRGIDSATAFVRVYRNGKDINVPAILNVLIVNEHDQAVVSSSESLEFKPFGTIVSADHRLTIPIPTLQFGSYVLSYQAVAGKHSARRDIRFTIR